MIQWIKKLIERYKAWSAKTRKRLIDRSLEIMEGEERQE